MKIAAPWLFDGCKWHRNMAVEWNGAQITSVVGSNDESDHYYGHCAILPGLLNLHAHLELTGLAGLLPRSTPFPNWVQALQSHTRKWDASTYRNSVQSGLDALCQSGCTTVLDVGNSGANFEFTNRRDIRLFARQELIGREFPQGGIENRFAALGEKGLSAHALYSCSASLIHSIAQDCITHNTPFTIHLAESQEELELFIAAQGAFRDWLDSIVPHHAFTQPVGAPWDFAVRMGVPRGSILVHGNMLSTAERAQIRLAHGTLVHCPQSARWFGHPVLDLPACLAEGTPVCIGTDSLASAESLSLWEQLRVVHERWPSISGEVLLSLVTSVPGRALNQNLGQIQPQYAADLIVVEVPDDFDGIDCNWVWDKPIRIRTKFVNGIKGDL